MLGDGAEVAAVEAAAAVVAHHEEHAVGHGDRAVAVGVDDVLRRVGALLVDVGLVEPLAVDEHRAVLEDQRVAGQADDPLDQVLDLGVGLAGRPLEDDDVAAVDVVELVRQLVDQHPITDVEGVHHRRRRDLVGLEQERPDEQRDDQRAADDQDPLADGPPDPLGRSRRTFGDACRRRAPRPRGPRGRPCPPCRVRRDPAPGRSREHRTPRPVRSDCDHRGRRGGGEEQRVVVRATAHRSSPRSRPGPGRRRRQAPRRSRRGAAAARRTPACPPAWPTVAARAARRNAAVVWWLRPWWRGRGSASEVRAATIGRPPRAAAASTIGATSSAVVPRVEPVPTTPGPMATTTTSAPATRTARSSADGTATASRSPPKAWPAVTVTSSSARSPQLGHQVGQGERQRGAVGHHVADARPGLQLLDGPRRRSRPGCAAAQATTGRPSRSGQRHRTAPAPRPRRRRPAGWCSGAS